MKRQLVMTEDALLTAQRRGVRAFLEATEAEIKRAGVYVEPARLDVAAGKLEVLSDHQLHELLRDVNAEVQRRSKAVPA